MGRIEQKEFDAVRTAREGGRPCIQIPDIIDIFLRPAFGPDAAIFIYGMRIFLKTGNQTSARTQWDGLVLVIAYSRKDRSGVYGYLLTQQGQKLEPLKDPRTGKPLREDDLTGYVAKLLKDAEAGYTASTLAKELYRALIKPFENELRDRDLILVPVGIMRQIPFAMLSDGTEDKDGRPIPMAAKYPFKIVASLSSLRLLRQAKKHLRRGTKRLLAVGRPINDKRPDDGRGRKKRRPLNRARWDGGSPWTDLESSEVEVKRLMKLFGNRATVYTRDKVKKPIIMKERWDRYDYLHFACHGDPGMTDREPAALILSTYEDPARIKKIAGPDAEITYTDILNQRTPNALVVLSACESARGKSEGGDIYSLARAFQGAVARAVAATLWQIDDFIHAFYRRLLDGQSAGAAMLASQRDYQKNGHPPRVWAPWIVIGE